ncbi:MAG: signal recognition particle protein [Chthonomonadales bacterium]|nr:signal recognition particle protein [Chthonomonadales bacterium]
MFDSLTDKLQGVFARLRGQGRLTEQDIGEALREVRMALLEADVNFKVVKEFVARVRERALGQDVIESLSGVQTVVKIVHDELTALLGGHDSRLSFAPRPPTVVMLCGLQGSGKTTTCAKLAHWMRRQGRNPLLVACDIYRPAAVRQLQVLGEQLGMPVFAESDTSPPRIAADAVRQAGGSDVVILDTAGRLHVDEAMMLELEQIQRDIRPTQTLLIVDAMTGQDAVQFAQDFHARLSVDGFVLTKLDGDARGGAALSIRSVTGVPIKFVGIGEKLDALETFHPERMASRILGMGDVLSLIEKAEQAIDERRAAEFERKLRENRFDLNDFLEQMQQMRKMGPLEQILGMIPGMGRLKGLEVNEKQLARQEALVRSMTVDERSDPSILNGGRKRRVAQGAGVTVQEVNQFLHQFEMMRQMIRQMMGGEAGHGKRRRRLRLPFGG